MTESRKAYFKPCFESLEESKLYEISLVCKFKLALESSRDENFSHKSFRESKTKFLKIFNGNFVFKSFTRENPDHESWTHFSHFPSFWNKFNYHENEAADLQFSHVKVHPRCQSWISAQIEREAELFRGLFCETLILFTFLDRGEESRNSRIQCRLHQQDPSASRLAHDKDRCWDRWLRVRFSSWN